MTRRRSSIKCFSKGSGRPSSSYARPDGRIVRTNFLLLYCADPALRARIAGQLNRSEERRVGKECRSRGGPDHLKKKTAFPAQEGTTLRVSMTKPRHWTMSIQIPAWTAYFFFKQKTAYELHK